MYSLMPVFSVQKEMVLSVRRALKAIEAAEPAPVAPSNRGYSVPLTLACHSVRGAQPLALGWEPGEPAPRRSARRRKDRRLGPAAPPGARLRPSAA